MGNNIFEHKFSFCHLRIQSCATNMFSHMSPQENVYD